MIKFFLLVSIVIFTGCGTSQKEVSPKQKGVAEKIVPKNTQPNWINNPDVGGFTGAVGIVKLMKNKKKQKYIAKKLAVASLQERKRIEIDTKVTTSQKVANNSKVSSKSTQETRQSSSHFKTSNIVQKDDFSDAENYYVWMVIKK